MWGLLQRSLSKLNIWCQCCERCCHQRYSGLRNLRRAGNNFRYLTYVKGVVAVPQRLEVGEDSLKIVDSFRYLGDCISCGGGVKSAVRDRISCAWSKWRELACVRLALLYAAETWALKKRLEGLLASCDHRMLRHMSRVRWQGKITNKEIRRRSGVENFENVLRKTRLRWFGHVKHRDENSIVKRAMEVEV